MSSDSVIPQGYTFMSPEIFISEKAKANVLDLLDESHRRNPDAYHMYIYNDYHSHGMLNLIENLFKSTYSDMKKKNWLDAYCGIETLTVLFEFESTWTTCEDGALTRRTNILYGALLLAILKGLEDEGNLTPQKVPNIEVILRTASTFAECMELIECESPYGAICKAVAKRLFQDFDAANRALFEARMREHAETVDPSEKEEMYEDIEEYLEENEGTIWYLEGEIGSDHLKDAPTALVKAWKDYEGSAPAVPLKGALEWDLTKWTEEQKRPFSFDFPIPDDFDI